MVAALKNGRSATIDGAWGSAAALTAAALGLHAPTTLVILLAHVGDVDDFRDDVATFAGIAPEVFPAWEKPPRELNAADEVFGRRMRVLKRLAGASPPRLIVAPFQATLQPVPKPDALARMSRTVAVGDVVPVESLTALAARARNGAGRGRRGARRIQRPRRNPRRLPHRRVRPGPHRVLRRRGRVDPAVRRGIAAVARSMDVGHADRSPRPSTTPTRPVSAIPVEYFPEGTWVALLEPTDLREEGRHYLGRLDDQRGLFTVERSFERLIRFPTIAVSTLSADSLETTCHLRIESIERFSGELTKVKAELDSAAAGESVLIACHNEAEVERLGEVFSDTELARIEPAPAHRRADPGRVST